MKKVCNSSPDGIHFLLEFFGCDANELDSVSFWENIFSEAIAESDVTLLNKHFYRFEPHGITGYLLLSASHISIHTWPEYGYVACDVFSCGGEEETKGIVKYIKMSLRHGKIRTRRLKRGFRVCP